MKWHPASRNVVTLHRGPLSLHLGIFRFQLQETENPIQNGLNSKEHIVSQNWKSGSKVGFKAVMI